MNRFGCGEGINPFVSDCLGVLAGPARPLKLCLALRLPISSHEPLISVARLAVLALRFVNDDALPEDGTCDDVLELAGIPSSSCSSRARSAVGMTDNTSAMIRSLSAPHVPFAAAPELGY